MPTREYDLWENVLLYMMDFAVHQNHAHAFSGSLYDIPYLTSGPLIFTK